MNDIHIPKSTIVQGKAGTGKSLVIAKVAAMVDSTFGPGSCILLGPTGVSALNINGTTIHSKLTIKTNEAEFTQLEGKQLHAFKRNFDKVKFVIIDEYSMVGCEMLHKIDSRLRQAKNCPNQEFGGVFLYMFGDINQLPPVMDCPMYSNNQKSMKTISGKNLFDDIDSAVFLGKIHRQDDARFQTILNNVSAGKISQEDYEILAERFTTKASFQERKVFEDAPHFFPTNEEKDNYNKDKLRNCKDPGTKFFKPVARIAAKITGKGVRSENDDLESVLYLSKGSKIMLKTNLWTEKGLVNGSVGEVVDIVYDPDATPQDDPPSALICRFESYCGPYLNENAKTVPIAPFQKSETTETQDKFTISQFPVCLCYACTIHKSQGLTVRKAFIDIGKREMRPGLTYVALSRVKSIEGLLLEPFPYSRCLMINRSKTAMLRNRWLESLRSKQYIA